MLAGISAEYYLRLGQGRDRHPSVQVLQSIARVLQLDDDTHLLGLATDRPRRTRRQSRRETLPPSTVRLVSVLPFPTFVEGRYLDVLAANSLATALSPRLHPGGNRLRDLLLDPAEQALFNDWERAAEALVAGFRHSVGTATDDPRFIKLVGELSIASPHFHPLWGRYDVGPRRGANLTIDHPQVGPIRPTGRSSPSAEPAARCLSSTTPSQAPTVPKTRPPRPRYSCDDSKIRRGPSNASARPVMPKLQSPAAPRNGRCALTACRAPGEEGPHHRG